MVVLTILLSLCLLSSSLGHPTTKIVNKGKDNPKSPSKCLTKLGEKCMFPFTYAGVEHSACTWADSPVPWCAVARAANGSVAANRWEERAHARWGDCEVSSPALCEVEPIQLPTCITTNPAPGASVRVVNRPEDALGLAGQKCVFPFRYKDVTYTSCTTEGRGQPWCSTSTSESGEHLAGSWGYCPPACPTACTPGSTWAPDTCNTCVCGPEGQAVCTHLPCSLPSPPPSSPSTRCLAEAGPSQGQACVLPFSFQGRVHNTCAPWTFGGEQEGKLWCSTRTSPLGVHIDGGGHYGFCSTDCGPVQQTPSSEPRLEGGKKNNQNIVFQNTLELLDYPN